MQSATVPTMATSLLGNVNQSALADAYILEGFLKSAALIDDLDKEFNLKQHFASPKLDLVRRLEKSPSKESFYDYFRKKIKITISPDSGIISLETLAFEPHLARQIAESMITKSEEAINQLNERMLASTTVLTETTLEERRQDLTQIRQKLLDFQISNQFVDADSAVAPQISNLFTLDARITDLEAELKTKSQFLRVDAYELKAVEQAIKALIKQREEEAAKLFGAEPENTASAAHEYEALKLEAEFILSAFTTALASNEQAKLDALKQQKFLLTISKPYTPEAISYPKTLKSTLTALIIISLIYGIIRLIIATVLDHTV